MKQLSILSIFVFFTFLISHGNENKSKYQNSDFSIKPLYDTTDSSGSQPLFMSLKATEGFAPNVNVQIQLYEKSLKEYSALSVGQFKQMKLKVIKSLISENVLIFEYSGEMNGSSFQWYSKAFKRGKNVYLVTATAKVSQWSENSKALKECVDSFSLNKK